MVRQLFAPPFTFDKRNSQIHYQGEEASRSAVYDANDKPL